MKYSVRITAFYSASNLNSDSGFDIAAFFTYIDLPFVLSFSADNEEGDTFYYFYHEDYSVTYFELCDLHDGTFILSLDGLASYDDYRLFPYVADSLNGYLNGNRLEIEGKSVFSCFDEEWIAESIGEEIAQIKASLSVAPRYYILMGREMSYVSLELLSSYAVNLHSSTPRIYGYIQYLMRKGRLPLATEEMMQADWLAYSGDQEVDVPQHHSIGRVKSWQKDGAVTWETFSEQDVAQLLMLAEIHRSGKQVDCVVLNDIGTIYQEGIGVRKDPYQAEFWFQEAYRHGDLQYAPANLGDLYRKGAEGFPVSLSKAFEAYSLSEEPYAQYRVGQAYEEGWNGVPDMAKAMVWYHKSADAGHHLAIKRLGNPGETHQK